MKILVTGGAGFIGSNIADSYIEAEHEVVIVDNLSSGKEKNINPKAKFYQADIQDKEALEKIFESEKPEIINHHAAQIDVRKSVTDPVFNAKVNEIGTLNLLELAVKHKTKKFILASTGGALFGEIKEKRGAKEDHALEPISPYAITKRAAELYLAAYHANYGLNYTVLRYGNVFGPRQDPHGEAGVIAIFIGKLNANESPFIYGNGRQLRDYVYVKDVCAANLLALKKGNNKIYNVGTGIGTSVNQLFAELKDIIGFSGKAIYKPPRAGELFRSVLNADKIKKELKWKPQTFVRNGLEKTVEYFKR
ncbi:UDP-glucose 4-epimerase [candidate division WOR-1 bacterium RIFOXYA12_FULL_43_27]|uniref:UDP-glucose 4-epimerase n=1 Tax=candidate division WOR-1 bacterium RIFOXYC2_FULL_46_14 TaxID=1802587 RepID=A0A1F4U6A6_UNCSA|nr:MAG: UDP-glucose 4-epimerase [candidate division WOR-1 bacterium RIFOXYA12_FULL_43_27]OGC20506.1 MAG: UDP-glucose 4-epimerase [candidate division WOR-1 bacterium RIFOXYB2_FULL_46_45]OGC31757.1 MAG: UDP-glucose 4-epimerase [candidate division WOR-1 bacterium RIFOXYA2_FULL_46_56]OGC40350.1 MAG: UDP-glucose 4-epimerase [candidate division WOR-1 bacterium RIFOXYC2_FULL_46_14]